MLPTSFPHSPPGFPYMLHAGATVGTQQYSATVLTNLNRWEGMRFSKGEGWWGERERERERREGESEREGGRERKRERERDREKERDTHTYTHKDGENERVRETQRGQQLFNFVICCVACHYKGVVNLWVIQKKWREIDSGVGGGGGGRSRKRKTVKQNQREEKGGRQSS